jgi:hypothetical protein
MRKYVEHILNFSIYHLRCSVMLASGYSLHGSALKHERVVESSTVALALDPSATCGLEREEAHPRPLHASSPV